MRIFLSSTKSFCIFLQNLQKTKHSYVAEGEQQRKKDGKNVTQGNKKTFSILKIHAQIMWFIL